MATIPASPDELRRRFHAALTDEAARDVARIVDIAARSGAVYVVGGAVRDLLLDRPIVDIDLVTTADAVQMVRGAFLDARVTTHAAFRTASIETSGVWIDVATARTETYDRPGALPSVTTPANIEDDLARRDFTMNALALRLDGAAFLVDPCGGVADIANRWVRVLHDASFRDDATRILRAFRYAARLGFEIDHSTRALIERDRSHLDAIGGERLRREFELTIGEAAGGPALEAMDAAGVLAAVHPGLAWDPRRSAALIAPVSSEPGLAGPRFGFALLIAEGTASDGDTVAERLRLTRDEAAAVSGVASLNAHTETLRRPEAKPSGVVVLLDRYPPASVAAFAATSTDAIAAQLALRYLEDWRHVKPILSGETLIEMGVPTGPQVARGLQLVRAARLDGWAVDRDDERALVLRFVKSIRDSGAMSGTIDLRFHAN